MGNKPASKAMRRHNNLGVIWKKYKEYSLTMLFGVVQSNKQARVKINFHNLVTHKHPLNGNGNDVQPTSLNH
jgi:hypothetical protein